MIRIDWRIPFVWSSISRKDLDATPRVSMRPVRPVHPRRDTLGTAAFVAAAVLFAAAARADMPGKEKSASAREGAGPAKPLSPDATADLMNRLAAQPALQKARALAAKRVVAPSPIAPWAANPGRLQLFQDSTVRAWHQRDRGVVAVEPAEAAAGGKPGTRGSVLARAAAGEKPSDTALRFIAQQRRHFGLRAPREELVLQQSGADALGIHRLVFQQVSNGIPIWGRQLAAHLDGQGNLLSINCLLEPSPSQPSALSTSPAISAAEALASARKRLADMGVKSAGFDPALSPLLDLPSATAAPTLYYWQREPRGTMELVWVVEIRPNLLDWYRVFVRASDGEILESYNVTQADGAASTAANNLLAQSVTVHSYQAGSSYYMIDVTRPMFVAGQTSDQLIADPKGCLVTLDLRNHDLTSNATVYHVMSPNNSWTDATSVSAHDYGARAFEYFRTAHGRNSLDGKGGSVLSIVHVLEDGKSMENAYWNGVAMVYGDGGSSFLPLARGLDVAVHEMTHGVTQNTADLEYKFQSGALNESFSDVFAAIVDNDDWRIGEDVARPSAFPSGALRDLQNPHNGGTSLNHNGWQPATMAEFVQLNVDQDNGGVHINSGIPNHAAYRVMNAIGRDDAGRIYYRALANYLLKQSNFTDARLALERAAKDLFGENSTQHNAVKNAFDAVGITTGGASQPPPDAPITQGDQYVLLVGVSDGLLYITTPAFTEFAALTGTSGTRINTDSAHPMAVDPFGLSVIFVDDAFALRGINTNGTGETIISDTTLWFSVAISPSGRRVALTRNFVENVIYILDLVDKTVTPIALYSPTFSEDIYLDIVKYADTLTWLDDEFLAYDARKDIAAPSGGGTITFWDVNVVDVTSGAIYPLVPPQPDGVNIANPTRSSRNPSILAIDYFDSNSGETAILGIDLYSGNVNTILDNQGSLGIPEYSVDDETLIFQRANAGKTSYDVYTVPLGADGITAAGAAQPVVNNAILPVWFALGTPLPATEPLIDYITGSGPSPGNVDLNQDGSADVADLIILLSQ